MEPGSLPDYVFPTGFQVVCRAVLAAALKFDDSFATLLVLAAYCLRKPAASNSRVFGFL
jgi:hypothetical protein